jgi:hypothetical protein
MFCSAIVGGVVLFCGDCRGQGVFVRFMTYIFTNKLASLLPTVDVIEQYKKKNQQFTNFELYIEEERDSF